ncbi:MAG: 2-oxoglutarate oxidoreductase [Chloroflexi bacterium]|nr:MAG: 2-oxoglutarate oxidoreductase [Anaerolineaceae bacterium 4572_32.2]RLC78890.1 MAG: 2-oxoglutarate oxidoreductase [Chloroflexota bacterium]RLC84543.1 MAG: 2-oxoglutarate oxidoreductase [Chloroflexota bacterium]HEY72601.1 2-oxoglutarate oxidoreductase [Thermoflexia bacterium]
MEQVYGYPESLTPAYTHYCPGCTHGTIHRLIAEVLDELGVRENTIGIAPVGCSVLAYYYFDVDMAEAAHGRAPAMATGLKRVSPDKVVFTYQGDGDLASIGIAEIVYAANRGEMFTTIFVNNAIYGMTGGQMAPTTLPGQVTTSSPTGRDVETAGFPMRMAELLGSLPGAAYVTRQAVLDTRGIRRAKKAIKLAFQTQLDGLGFSMVEIISTCPTNWHLGPEDALDWAKEHMVAYFPLGDTKMSDGARALKEGK